MSNLAAALDYATAYDDLPVPVSLVTPAGRVRYVNADCAALTGHDRAADLVGLDSFDRWPEYAEQWERAFAAALRDGRHRYLEAFLGRWFSTTIRREPSGLLLVLSRDVTAGVASACLRTAIGAFTNPDYPKRRPLPAEASIVTELLSGARSIPTLCEELGMPPALVIESLRQIARDA